MGIKERLERDCNRIDGVFHRHGVPGRTTGGRVTPYVIRYRFDLKRTADADRAHSLAGELAAALGVPTCRVARRGAAVVVEVPRSDPVPVRLLPLLRTVTDVPPVTAALGIDEEGVPLFIRLPSPTVRHILVSGVEGCGKTNLLRAMALSLVLRHPRSGHLVLVLIDPRGGQAFGCFEGLSHLARPVVRDPVEAVEALSSLVRLVEQRRWMGDDYPPVVAFIDNLAGLEQLGSHHLAQLVERGHEVGIHLVAAAKDPVRVPIDFPMHVASRTAVEQVTGQGDFIIFTEGERVLFKAAYVSPGEIVEAVAALRRKRPAAIHRSAPIPLPAPA